MDDETSDDLPVEAPEPKKLLRDPDEKTIAGVAAGFARYLGISPVWVRAGLLVSLLFGGLGAVLYIAAWILVPEAQPGTWDDDLPDPGVCKSREDRKLAGVCGGLAETLGIDATLVRLLFVAAVIVAGVGLVLYIVLALLLPNCPPEHVVDTEVVEPEPEAEPATEPEPEAEPGTEPGGTDHPEETP